jgi:hypothetical protein
VHVKAEWSLFSVQCGTVLKHEIPTSHFHWTSHECLLTCPSLLFNVTNPLDALHVSYMFCVMSVLPPGTLLEHANRTSHLHECCTTWLNSFFSITSVFHSQHVSASCFFSSVLNESVVKQWQNMHSPRQKCSQLFTLTYTGVLNCSQAWYPYCMHWKCVHGRMFFISFRIVYKPGTDFA